MPPIVKASYASIKKHAGEHPVILITKDNIKQLLSDCTLWDDEIYKYVQTKKISFTHLSDLFRLCILYSKGGIWIDATIIMNWDIDKIVEGLAFVSGRRVGVKNKYSVPQGKWTTYFMGSAKGNLLLKFIYEVLTEHLRNEGRFVDYFMQDYTFVVAYNHLPYVREMVDAIPPMPARFNDLHKIRNKEYSPSYYEKMCREVPFFKMTYKKKLIAVTASGQPTFYGHILSLT